MNNRVVIPPTLRPLRRILTAAVPSAIRIIGHLLLASAVILLLLLLIAAYGIPGRWVTDRIRHLLPAELSGLSCDSIAFRPLSGIILSGIRITDNTGAVRCTAEYIAIGLRLNGNGNAWTGHIDALTIRKLTVPSFEWTPPQQPSPAQDLTVATVPALRAIRLTLDDVSVFDVRIRHLTGRIRSDVPNGTVSFAQLRALINDDQEQIEGEVTLDIRDAKALIRLRGILYPHRLLGIYRFLDFPVIEAYSNNFVLNAPIWANCSITVGFDKWRDLFELDVDLVSRHGGTYCGVPFDTAEGHISCRGIETAITEIAPLTVRRGDRIAASGRLRFDCPADRFTFSAESEALMPNEILQAIDMPFTEAIPEIRCEQPPRLKVVGSMPFMTDPCPDSLRLAGTIVSEQPLSVAAFPFDTLSSDLTMQDGILTFLNLKAGFIGGGSAEGSLALDIPPSADYTDLCGNLTLRDISIRDALTDFLPTENLPDLFLSGPVSLTARTDDTCLSTLNGTFDLTASGNRVLRLPVFAGLTDLLADYIPGISALTDTTEIWARGTIRNGMLRIPDIRITGSVLAIEGDVAYDIPHNDLGAALLVGIFREGSVIGNLTRWALLPLSRLMMEIIVSGPLEAPEWTRASTLNKLLPRWEK